MSSRLQKLAFAATVILVQFPLPVRAAVSITGDTTLGPQQVIVGNTGFGTLRIDGGSIYNNPTSSQSTIGSQSAGNGIATVTGLGSQWNFPSSSTSLVVGQSGVGRLEILAGGVVAFSNFGGVAIATSSSSHGTVIVDGNGSTLQLASSLQLGGTSPTSGGNGLLRISNGAIVNSSSSTSTISASGRVELDGGLLRVSQLNHGGVIIGSGELSLLGTSIPNSNGRFEAGVGDLLRITGTAGGSAIQNLGIIAAHGGEIEFQRAVTNMSNTPNTAEITLRDGIIRVGTTFASGPPLTNSAILAAIGGQNDFYGRISNTTAGRIAVTNNSSMIFHDDVTAEGGVITVFPGSSAVFLEDLTMNAEATLLADLAGSTSDSGYGDIEVVGTAELGGSLSATLADNFTPQAGDSFSLLAASAIVGSLGLGDMPDLPSGLMWDLDIEGNFLKLNVVPGLAGDYNDDNVVDAADFIVWRESVGQTGNDLAADGNSDGVVDDADFNFWRARVGNGGSAVGSAATIPEPAAATLLLLAALVALGHKRS
jgi:T5SS/PEP-CTERM-associated repeat protein